MDINHNPCLFKNKDFGIWEEVKKPFPYGWFFKYFELKHEKSTYFDRVNRMDGVFDWICSRIKKLVLIAQ